ncbi:TPA: helix-turn-helix domain-containing protein [Vibrio cholerae]|nr:helix-turn-helix domain-containing protein [Vibrio cholerae]RJL28342.1 DNA-binding protein [Vibrio cholerae]UWY92556.1 helix-turn-helix domain-containing protein [Vibrio cholerae]UWY96118.1 helix-turn-helix domain-containing protein [Vibrio cholerae]
MATYLKLAEKNTYRFTSESKLPSINVGGSWGFKCDAFDVWIESLVRESKPCWIIESVGSKHTL